MSNSPTGQQPRDPRADEEIERLKAGRSAPRSSAPPPMPYAESSPSTPYASPSRGSVMRATFRSRRAPDGEGDARAKLLWVLGLGAALGVTLGLLAHFTGAVWLLNNLGPLGASISLVVGLVYGLLPTKRRYARAMLGGLLVGAGCALAGTASSFLLGDVLWFVLPFGTLGGAAAGALGGLAGRLVRGSRRGRRRL